MYILTIDFDIIMEPSINFYNNMVPNISQEDLATWPMMAAAQANLETYNKLTKFLLDITRYVDKEHIHFIQSHEQVIKYIPTDKPLTLVNIDHHHDIGYDSKGDKDCANCGNWAKWVIEHSTEKITFNWINNPNSYNPSEIKDMELISYQNIIQQVDLTTYKKPDEVIICYSEAWIPLQFRPLFFSWFDMLNTIYQTHFEFDPE